jgi:exodeoxyribonuclease VII small subunit
MARRKTGKSPEPEVRYGEAVEEIERILEAIDREEIDIDELSEKVERAVTLIRVCQEKLRATETRVTEVLAELEETAVPEGGEEGGPAVASSSKDRPATGRAARDADRDADEELEDDDGLPF